MKTYTVQIKLLKRECVMQAPTHTAHKQLKRHCFGPVNQHKREYCQSMTDLQLPVRADSPAEDHSMVN